jgi:hypothetical protein
VKRSEQALRRLLLFAVLGSVGFTSTERFAAAQANLLAFRSCIAGSNVTCTLNYTSTPYQIAPSLSSTNTGGPPLVVSGSNVTVTSNETYPNWPTLQRASTNGGYPFNSPFSIMTVTGSGVLVEDLIFNGNRFGFGSGNGSFACLVGEAGAWYDLDALGATGTMVQYIQILNSPGMGLVLPASTPPATQPPQPGGVYVYNSLFEYTRHVAIYASQNDVLDYNIIEYSGINGVQTSGSGQLIEYNSFYQNHDEWWAGSTGGELIVYGDNSNVQVINNVINGNNATCPASGCYSPQGGCFESTGSAMGTGGVEHYGANGTFTNNQIENHYQQGGIGSGSAINGLTINGIDPGFTAYVIQNNAAGVAFGADGNTGTWTFTNLQAINNNNGGPENGVWLTGSGPSINWGSGACLTGNNGGPVNLGSGWTYPPSTDYNCQ